MNLKLGKHPKRNDPRTLKLAKYLTQLPPIPAAINWSNKVPVWGLLKNDELGDCTCAAVGHMEMLWTSQAGIEYVPSDADIVSAYSAIAGYQPGNPDTDQGANMIDVLNFWRNAGISGRRIQAYVEASPSSVEQVSAAIYLFGGLYVGVRLPQSAMDQTNLSQCWDGITDTNILGGHAINLIAYDQYTLACVTWGRVQLMTWSWFQHYADEAYAVLSPDWLSASGFTTSGFNIQQLSQDLKAL